MPRLVHAHIGIPLVYMGGIYMLSSIPGDTACDDWASRLFVWVTPGLQNALHIPLFAVLAALWFWALRPWLRQVLPRVILAALFAIAFGVFDEWHQAAIPGRHSSLTDVVLNALGSALGLWLAVAFLRHRRSEAEMRATRD